MTTHNHRLFVAYQIGRATAAGVGVNIIGCTTDGPSFSSNGTGHVLVLDDGIGGTNERPVRGPTDPAKEGLGCHDVVLHPLTKNSGPGIDPGFEAPVIVGPPNAYCGIVPRTGQVTAGRIKGDTFDRARVDIGTQYLKGMENHAITLLDAHFPNTNGGIGIQRTTDQVRIIRSPGQINHIQPMTTTEQNTGPLLVRDERMMMMLIVR